MIKKEQEYKAENAMQCWWQCEDFQGNIDANTWTRNWKI